jgi:hypothetical protein
MGGRNDRWIRPALSATLVTRTRGARLVALSAVVFTLVAAPQGAEAISLQSLIGSHGTITVGDKLFSNFDATLTRTPGVASASRNGPTTLDNIEVAGVIAGSEIGLRFTAPPSGFDAFATSSVFSFAFSSWTLGIGYDVQVVGTPALIDAFTLGVSGRTQTSQGRGIEHAAGFVTERILGATAGGATSASDLPKRSLFWPSP